MSTEIEELEAIQPYRIWRVDCPCGTVIDYGEDESTVPERCEDCGTPVADPSGS